MIQAPLAGSFTDSLVKQSESAQLTVVCGSATGEAVARSARMPVLVLR